MRYNFVTVLLYHIYKGKMDHSSPYIEPFSLMRYNTYIFGTLDSRHMEVIMEEELQKQDPYRIDLMRTLWENTYRGTIFDYKEQYVATVRLVLSIPLDRSEVPSNAPKVNPMIIALVEDTVLSPIDVVDFEQAMTPILAKKFATQYFQPDRILYFYPSPVDGAETKGNIPTENINVN